MDSRTVVSILGQSVTQSLSRSTPRPSSAAHPPHPPRCANHKLSAVSSKHLCLCRHQHHHHLSPPITTDYRLSPSITVYHRHGLSPSIRSPNQHQSPNQQQQHHTTRYHPSLLNLQPPPAPALPECSLASNAYSYWPKRSWRPIRNASNEK